MQITRKATWDAFSANWCPVCAKTVEMEHMHTGLPGIAAQKCPECCANYQANYLENGDDMLTIPDGYVMPNVELNGAPLAARPSDRRERF